MFCQYTQNRFFFSKSTQNQPTINLSLSDVEDGKRGSTTASSKSQSQKLANSNKDDEASDVDSTSHAPSSAHQVPPQGEEITPRANVVVNDVEISHGEGIKFQIFTNQKPKYIIHLDLLLCYLE